MKNAAAYARMGAALRSGAGYYFCIACQRVTTPINCGEAQTQRCEHCDSSRIVYHPRFVAYFEPLGEVKG